MKTSSIALAIFLLATAQPLRGLEVPLVVEEPAGAARVRGPVSSGICFHRGEVRPDQAFSLFDGDRELPLQTAPLVVDRDGSLRWVLLDFPLDLGPKERKSLLLRAAPGKARFEPALEISETRESVTVSTGPLKAAISKTRPFALLERAEVSGVPVVAGGAVDLVEAKSGTKFDARAPEKVLFEYRGPYRATLRIEGEYEGPSSRDGGPCPRYIARLTFHAGSSAVRLEHILANSNREQVTYLNLKSASLRLRHTPGAESPEIRIDPSGWATWKAGQRALFLCDRDFLGDPPRRLEAGPEFLAAEFVSAKPQEKGRRGEPFLSDDLWLYDLSHKTADLWIDFAAAGDPGETARAFRARLLAFAPPGWYSDCDVLGVGRFGTLEDEKKVYRAWGWKFDEKKVPRSPPDPQAFVRWEDNHYESEADSVEALLLMALRTGERGFFDRGEAWARYHANLHAWRTDGWTYDDGAIWFPQGGPLGTRPARKPSPLKYEHWGKGSGDDQELWRLVQAKSCYCHFYGAGLADHFLLTGSRDSLEAALDLAEQKDSEFRKHRRLEPGKTVIDDTRGFGRGFYVLAHILDAVPENQAVRDLVQLCRDVLLQAPDLDERGFAPCHIGTGFGGFDPKRDIPPEMKAFMERESIRMDEKGWLQDRAGNRWPAVCLGGTWQHAYIGAAADLHSRRTGDEDLADFAEGFGRFAARHLLSEKCKQVHYYAYMDVPVKGRAWDPWEFQAAHVSTKDGVGCEHEGWYTRFFPDAIATAYSLSGDEALLLRAREFWHHGSKRGYRTRKYSAGSDEVGEFATHVPPKDDSVLSTSRLFYEWSRPRADRVGPEAIRDLSVTLEGGGKARVRFTAPADRGGGKVALYQVKCAGLPIVPYDEYDFARDDGKKRNFWRARNLSGEPAPSAPGAREEFLVTGVPDLRKLYFVVASLDESRNRSPLSNEAAAGSARSE